MPRADGGSTTLPSSSTIHPEGRPGSHRSDRSSSSDTMAGPSRQPIDADSAASMSDEDDLAETSLRAASNASPGGLSSSYDARGSQGNATKSSNNKQSAKRQRVHFSCTECHRRKQKCDRNQPCNHCLARKIPERCKTFQPGEDPSDLSARMTQLERNVQTNFERMFAMLREEQRVRRQSVTGGSHAASAYAKDETGTAPMDRTGLHDWRHRTANALHAGVAPSPTYQAKQAEGSEAGDEVVVLPNDVDVEKQEQKPIPSGSKLEARLDSLMTDGGQKRGVLLTAPFLLTDSVEQIEGCARLDAVMHEMGATYNVTPMMTSAMPPRPLFDALVNHFFTYNNWMRQPMSRRRVMRTYDAFWEAGAALTVNNTNAYATFMSIAAISLITYRGKFQVSEDPHVIQLTAKRIYFAARQGLLMSTMLGREDIQQVVAFSLAARYLFLDRRISEAWSMINSAVKTAISIGLHRDGSLLNLSHEETAARRRIWSTVYFGDKVICMSLGRPSAIDDDVIDTHFINEDDERDDFEEYFATPPGVTVPSGDRPKFLTYTRLRIRMAQLMGRVIKIQQNVQSPAHYADVVELDNALTELHNSYPDHLRTEFDSNGDFQHVNTRWDEAFLFVPVHRFLAQTELLNVRLNLHRSYLLRPTGSTTGQKGHYHPHHRYRFSRRSCIEAAYQTLALRNDLSRFIRRGREKECQPLPPWTSYIGTSNMMSALVILGIYLLMEPHASDAEILLKPIQFVYDGYVRKRARTGERLEPSREREFALIKLFIDRIAQARKAVQMGPPRKRASESEASHQVKRRHTAEEAQATDGNDTRRVSFAGEEHRGSSAGVSIAENVQNLDDDTAKVLLDLNQGISGRRGNANGGQSTAANEALGDSGNKATQGLTAEDSSLPWPYLPMRTPHHNALASPHGVSTSASSTNNDPTPPTLTPVGGNGHSLSNGDDAANGVSVHQLFDSWFRYNSFENIDIDALQMPQPADVVSGAGSNGDFRQHQSRDSLTANKARSTTNPTMDASTSGMMGWPNIQMPTYMSGGNGEQPTGLPSAINDATPMAGGVPNAVTTEVPSRMGDIGIPPGPRDSFFQDDILAQTSNMDAQQQFNAASYDPAFWQSLIDKITG